MCINFSVEIGRHGVGIAVGIVISLGFIIFVTVIIITKNRIGNVPFNYIDNNIASIIHSSDKRKSVPLKRNAAYELHHPQPQRTPIEQQHSSPTYEVVS